MIFGIAMVRDEDDILDITLRHTLAHVDHVLIADNVSVDSTRKIIERAAADTGRVTVVDDPERGYYQSRKMTALAARAAEMGATWVVPWDADELWTAGEGRIADILEAQPGDIDVVEADFFHHCPTALDPPTGTVVDRMGWRTRESAIPKVACRTQPGLRIEQGNHAATIHEWPALAADIRFVIHHYPYRSVEQTARKVQQGADAYAAAPDLHPRFGFHWKQMAASIDAGAVDQFTQFFRPHPDQDDDLIYDVPHVRYATA